MTDTTATRADRLAALRAVHFKSYASAADETWDRDPICHEDGHAWPCNTAEALDLAEEATKAAETMRGDVHHHVNPVIGMLRWHFQGATGVDPLDVPNDASGYPSREGLPEDMQINTNVIVSALRKMQAATDAADAALGEEPMRVQIERMQAEIAAEQARSQETDR